MNFGLNLWNKVFCRMFGLIVILFMTLSGHPWIINKMKEPKYFSWHIKYLCVIVFLSIEVIGDPNDWECQHINIFSCFSLVLLLWAVSSLQFSGGVLTEIWAKSACSKIDFATFFTVQAVLFLVQPSHILNLSFWMKVRPLK